jgi:apoptosis-inducing factor 2
MANAVRKLFFYGIVEHLQLLLRLLNVILLHLNKDNDSDNSNNKKPKEGDSDAASSSTTSREIGTTTSQQQPAQPRHRVAIVGASFAGCKVEQILSQHADHYFDITWIDEKSYFEYIPGSLRCLVEPDHFHRISCALPPDGVLLNIKTNSNNKTNTTRFIQGRVVDIPSASTLRLADGSEVTFDSLVLCAGSTYACCPIVKPADTGTITSALDRLASYHAEARKIRAAHTIAIIGAGAVGVELAGELLLLRRQSAHLRRARKIILIDQAETILSGFPPATIQYATDYLQRRHVELHLGANLLEIGDQRIVLADGTVLAADLVYRCIGAAPNTHFLEHSILKDALRPDQKQALAVNDRLQVVVSSSANVLFTNIYAAGDIMHHANSNEVKLGHTAELNGAFIAESLIAQIVHSSGGNGGETLTEQEPPTRTYPHSVVGQAVTPFIYCISLGKYDGTLGFNGFVINGFIAALAKWLIEWTKVAAVQKQPVGLLFWRLGDAVSHWLGRTLLVSSSSSRPTNKAKQE